MTLPRHPELLQTPTLLVHLDRVRHNLAAMRRWLGGDLQRWRPHLKTCKVPEVLALLLQQGLRQCKCATTREVEVLFGAAARAVPGERLDVLVAMALRGPNLARLAALAAAAPQHRLAVLAEDPQHAQQLRDLGLRVFVDLDPGFHRTGIPLAERGRIAAVVAAAGPALAGLHCYDGHLHHGDLAARTAAAHAIYAELVALADALGVTAELCTSGTPTFPAGLSFAGFAGRRHTIGPGTVVYWDARSDQLGIDGFQCAVEVQATVIGRPAEDRFTLDAGSKALDAAAGEPVAEWRGGAAARALVPSEEHLPMRMLAGAAPPLGAVLRLVPRHVCPTVNLADEAALLDGGEVTAVVPVRARGHETLPAVAGAAAAQETRRP